MKLPVNCSLDYFPGFLTKAESEAIYQDLTTRYQIAQCNKKYPDGKLFISENGKLMFVDEDLYNANTFPKKVWGNTAVWSDLLKKVKEKVESLTNHQFHVCVCMYYPNGTTGVGYHSDYAAFGDTSVIPSISLGEEREFLLREKSSQKEHSILLEEGSILIMGKHCQDRYEHCLPVNPIYKNGRVNLTFRQFGFSD